jgi:hypothetical protein
MTQDMHATASKAQVHMHSDNAPGAAKLKVWIHNGSVARGMHRKDQAVMLCLQLAKV